MSTRLRILTVPVGERLVTETCCACGVLFAMAEDFYTHRLADRKSFYCPAGHGQSYTGKSDAQKLKEAETRETALRDQLAAANRDAEAGRRRLVRERARFAAGGCPCCGHVFNNVRRHMASKHPDYDPSDLAAPAGFECSCGKTFETQAGLHIHQGHVRYQDGAYRWDDPKTPDWARHLTVVGS